MDSPRGRLYLMRAVAEGRLSRSPRPSPVTSISVSAAARARRRVRPACASARCSRRRAREHRAARAAACATRWLDARCSSRSSRIPTGSAALLGLARRYQRWGLQTPGPAQPACSRAFRAWPRMDALLARRARRGQRCPSTCRRGARRAAASRCSPGACSATCSPTSTATRCSCCRWPAGTWWSRAGRAAAARSSSTPGALEAFQARARGAGRGVARRRRLRRHQRGGLRLGHARVRPLAPRRRGDAAGRPRPRRHRGAGRRATLPLGPLPTDGRPITTPATWPTASTCGAQPRALLAAHPRAARWSSCVTATSAAAARASTISWSREMADRLLDRQARPDRRDRRARRGRRQPRLRDADRQGRPRSAA